ncbi:MAG: hypothetical protein WAT79_06675 [Saprospiraceae bacterium]
MNNKRNIALALFLFFGLCSLQAQKALYKAKLQYDAGSFTEAKSGLLNYLSGNPADIEGHISLAECHYALGQWNDCIFRLEKVVHMSNIPPRAYSLYGQSLKQVGRYEEAKINFQKYSQIESHHGDHLVQSVDYAMYAMSIESKFDIISMPYNSSASDFGLTFYNNVPVFSSFRTDILMDEMQKTSNQFSGVQKSYFYTNKKHHFIKGLNNKLDEIGPLSFSSNGEYCALVESKMTEDCNIRCDKKSGVLYLVKLSKNGEILEQKSFVHNEVGSSIHSAHFAYDGKALYFSSNRPGGFGGFDLYVSYHKDGFWSLPVNLGKEVNTDGNEITPYYNNGEMFFSSDYHFGLGGYDIFKTRVVNGIWTAVENMGHGINSIGDDYFPTLNSKGELFITSNRLGGKGDHDIYKAIQVIGDEEPLLSAIVVNLVPPALSLESLEEKKSATPNSTSRTVALTNTSSEVKTNSVFILPEFDRNTVGYPVLEVSLEGARRISLGNIAPTSEVFFIQLASVTQLEPNLSKFSSLIEFGNIYKMEVNQLIKVRLGYFMERNEAEEVLKKVRRKGFGDAFMTHESLIHSNMELLIGKLDQSGNESSTFSSNNIENTPSKTYGSGSKYKVRLASYEDPIWFDINKVKDIGRIEQWTKGIWTIFILAGYENIEEAKAAQIQALNRGFKTSEVVIDNGGVLERLKQN